MEPINFLEELSELLEKYKAAILVERVHPATDIKANISILVNMDKGLGAYHIFLEGLRSETAPIYVITPTTIKIDIDKMKE